MPDRPPGICRVCGKIAPDGRHCAEHQSDNLDLRNAADRQRRRRAGVLGGLLRLYDTVLWRVRTRRLVLDRDPLCRIAIKCGGRALSTEVDHVIRAEVYIASKGGDETLFYDPENLRGACHRCHAYKTALENAGKWHEKFAIKALAEAGEGENHHEAS